VKFSNKPESAKVFSGTSAADDCPPATLAAWFEVARVLLNLDETITRE